MININTELRQSYFSLLAGNILIDSVAIPIYYAQAPINNPSGNPSNYVLINSIFSSGFNDDTFNYTDTTVQLLIVTKALQNNSGAIADDIAGQIYCIIYPGPNPEVVQIVSGWVMNTTCVNDIVQSGLNDGQQKVVNRLLQIKHKIRHYPCDFGNLGFIYWGVQDTSDDPTDFSNALNQSCELPITIDYGAQPLPKFFWLAIPSGCSLKTDWSDLNGNDGNAAKIGATTDLYEIRAMDIMGDPYDLYITRYVTGFNGVTCIVRYFIQ